MSVPPNASNDTMPAPNGIVRTCRCQNWGQILRELVTTVISLLIVGLALLLLWDVYCGAKTTADTFDRQKEILSLALGLLGTVTGYYFGRVPADHETCHKRPMEDPDERTPYLDRGRRHRAAGSDRVAHGSHLRTITSGRRSGRWSGPRTARPGCRSCRACRARRRRS